MLKRCCLFPTQCDLSAVCCHVFIQLLMLDLLFSSFIAQKFFADLFFEPSAEFWPADSSGGWKLHPFHQPSRWECFSAERWGRVSRSSFTDVCEICALGLHHEGIFRVPGSQRVINLLRDAFERGKGQSLHTFKHLISFLFKSFSCLSILCRINRLKKTN